MKSKTKRIPAPKWRNEAPNPTTCSCGECTKPAVALVHHRIKYFKDRTRNGKRVPPKEHYWRWAVTGVCANHLKTVIEASSRSGWSEITPIHVMVLS